jgi:type I restriction-modification system DNA methylase subunit
MTIEELKLSKVKTLLDFGLYLKTNSQQGLHYIHYVPDMISSLVADISKIGKPTNAIVLNSNFGEISSKLVDIKNVISIDINVKNIEIAKYFNPNLIFLNEAPLNYSDSNKFDFVVVFPPFGQKLEVNGRNYSSETLHVEKALTLLSDTGTAIIIISNNFLTASAYSQIRNTIINQYCLDKIITLPKGTMVTTSIEISVLIIKKGSTLKTDFYTTDSNFEITFSVPSFSVLKEKLGERWDFHFHNPKNQIYQEELDEYKTEKIGNLVEIYLGEFIKQEDRLTFGKYKILTPSNFKNGHFESTSNDGYIEKIDLNSRQIRAIVKKGDILLSRIYRENNTIYIHSSDEDKYIANQHIVILRGKNAEYVATYLSTKSGLNLFNQQINRHKRGNIAPVISLQDLANIQIPILPISDLELASKNKLEKLSYDELIKIREKYDLLKVEYSNLKNDKKTSPHQEQLESLQQTLEQVLTNQQEHTLLLTNIESKIDDIKTVILKISHDFKDIQNLPRDIEEKILRLNKKLEEQISNLHFEQKQIDTYIKEIKNWFDYYDILESKSQKYLPEAEYIFDHISKLDNPDYSPFILQYCRALENELLSKIFRAYVQSLLDKNVVFDEKFAWDLGKKESGKPNDENTLRLSKHIQKCLTKNTDDWFFELGSMEVNLRYLTGRTIERSPLLQDLKEFILDRFEKELLNIEYLDEIKTIIKDFRNQSAHPNLMDTEKAIEFHKQIKECLINLMENYKNKGNAKD